MRTSHLSLDQAPPESIPMRFFMTVPIFGIVGSLLIIYNGISLFQTSWQNNTIVFTHILTLGWLAMTMIGSFYQMIPVLIGGKVPGIRISKLVFIIFIIGLLSFLTGLMYFEKIFFLIAITSLIPSFLIFIIQIIIPLFNVKADRPVVLAMRISIISLLAAIILGVISTGWFTGWWIPPFGRAALKGAHLTLGLFGWIVCLIIGVSFHVIPMFWLTQPFPEKLSKRIIYGILISIVLVPLGFLLSVNEIILIILATPGIAGIIIYSFITYKLLLSRKRKIVDTTMKFWFTGLLSLPLSAMFFITYPLIPDERFFFLFGIIFLFGFALSITTGMLYKIVPFLVWFHRYSNFAGLTGVPLLKDILPETKANINWNVFSVMFIFLIAGLLMDSDILIRLAGFFFLANSFILFKNIYLAVFKSKNFNPPEINKKEITNTSLPGS